jgi:hypothetical protein
MKPLEWLAYLVFTAGAGAISYVGLFRDSGSSKALGTGMVRLSLFDNQTIRLGDNVYARQGGRDLPDRDVPGSQWRYTVYYDKLTRELKTDFGTPDVVHELGARFGPRILETNLAAWQHITLSDVADGDMSSNGALGWAERRGNYYDRVAAFAVFQQVNLYRELIRLGQTPEEVKIAQANFWCEGLHGGKRPEQPSNIVVLIDSSLVPLVFSAMTLRQLENVRVPLPSQSFSLSSDKTLQVAVVVLPFEEEHPTPPLGWSGDRRGPAHFRDVELRACELSLTLERKDGRR